ncbi:MAG: hypothetical protein WD733_19945, partial [Bryobacterales bacterium]
YSFTLRAATRDLRPPLVGTHIAGLAADEGFISFADTASATELTEGLIRAGLPAARASVPARPLRAVLSPLAYALPGLLAAVTALPMAFRACRTRGGKPLGVSRKSTPSHIVLLENFLPVT